MILIADGGVSTRVTKIEKGIVTVEVLNDGKIGSRKNMCLPGAVITLPTIGPHDEVDIIDFGIKHKVDFIAISFARYKRDLDNLRRMLIEKDPEHGPYMQLISKIENHEAITNLDEIIEGSDGIMVARGDLGMEVPLEKVVILQKYITERAINAGRFVVTATQMLESMETKPRPTRAEVSDIINAVYDLTDANMTSGETTNGQFPTECARFLKVIAQEAEATCDYKRIFEQRKKVIKDRVAIGAIALSFELECDFIFLETDNVKLIHRLSSLRPRAYLIIFSNNQSVKGAVAIDFGVYVYPKDPSHTDPTLFLKHHGENYGFKPHQNVRILKIEMDGVRISSSRIHEVN
jgi:pyruvate kinase